jgi:hypothetical protein
MTGTIAVLGVIGIWLVVLLMVFAHFRFLTMEHRLDTIERKLATLHRRTLWSSEQTTNRSNDHDE